MFVTNSHGERLLLSRFLRLSSQDTNKVSIVSHEGSSYELSRFTFGFISNLSFEDDTDKILTPISQDNLENITRFLSFQDQDNFESINAIVEDARILGIDVNQLYQSSASVIQNNTKSESEELESNVGATQLTLQEITSHNQEVFSIKMDDQIRSNSVELNLQKEINEEDKITTKDKRNGKGFRNEKYRLEVGNPVIVWEGDMEIARSLTCQLCGKIFDSDNFKRPKVAYKEHYRGHEREATDCGCGIEFRSSKQRSSHWRMVHQGHLKCQSCHEVFSSDESLAAHMQSTHQTKKCDQCDFKTRRGNYAMKIHKRNMHTHKENKDGFACPDKECKRIFSSKGVLNAHFNKVHVKGVSCPECGKEVKNMQQHMEAMHAAKKYQCDKCPKVFGILHSLKNHDLVDHQGIRYYCRYSDCQTPGQEYRDSSNRSAHEKKRHGGVFKAALPDNLSIINKG